MALAAFGAAAAPAARADLLRHCAPPPERSAAEHDRQLRFAEIVKAELQRSGAPLAIVARTGMNLARVGLRYSHAGIALRANAQGPWAVRQLYYDCDAGQSRLFDQGLSGFVFGIDDDGHGRIAALLLPGDAAAALERAALDDRRALQLLGPAYSANAYAFGLRYQNCNQWLVELLAAAWSDAAIATRAQAQDWLRRRGYRPTRVDIASQPWLWLALASPWLHVDDHPPGTLQASQLEISMPEAIEAFVQAQLPQGLRIEACRIGTRVVLRRGGVPLDDDCRPGAGDSVLAID